MEEWISIKCLAPIHLSFMFLIWFILFLTLWRNIRRCHIWLNGLFPFGCPHSPTMNKDAYSLKVVMARLIGIPIGISHISHGGTWELLCGMLHNYITIVAYNLFFSLVSWIFQFVDETPHTCACDCSFWFLFL